MIGSLIGAGVAAAGLGGVEWHELWKAIQALVVSPIVGFGVAFGIARLLAWLLPEKKEKQEKRALDRLLSVLQVVSSAAVSLAHGTNDSQKSMGIITVVLATVFSAHGYTTTEVPTWVIFAAAAAIALGTATGGRRVMKTVGEGISLKGISPRLGFAAETTTALTVLVSTYLSRPVSTTHTHTSGVFGATWSMHGRRHCSSAVFKSILKAWVLTLPAACALARSPTRSPVGWFDASNGGQRDDHCYHDEGGTRVLPGQFAR